ncbi:membrane-associated zinc metalloprotease [Desulfofarcimen acetoxidans DSM 771]|uniref:Zinc metalloprotease n=1 Tax=Desulfofarcimen acetoxidans (strain ATCC 49208 / DSM 771 / KCTC 5769 / VKM B-1644 / 5575) TaxID=485916 RepID=C8W4Q9_DESAS|nr:RIP metalloprotease RseP [Desulfofarcimen acetoxidans]ACV63945.1 membrane-associated zinc metalloprotease [Desulfofarcimen acetoxidans DSM 771]
MSTFFASVFVFAMLIFFHELGHFAVAKLAGIKVHEFSVGFGPKLFGKLHGETTYNLRLLPLGGFVRMAGMDPADEADYADERAFNKKSILQRMAVIFAGPLMNFFLAALLLAFIFMAQGYPAGTTTGVDKVLPGYPAEKIGLVSGDKIVAIDGRSMDSWEQVAEYINQRPDKQIVITVERDAAKRSFDIVPVKDESGHGKIGIYPAQEMKKMGFFTALYSGAEYTVKATWFIISFIGKMFVHEAPVDLGGPVRVVWEIGQAANTGFYHLLQLAAFLSINLGLFNLFPIPALDGSRVVFLFWEALRGKPVDPSRESFIHLVGFVLLLVLMVVITYNDLLNLL